MRASTLQKRTKIIEVATELFLEQGYKATSMDQIIAVCGGSKQTPYRYFNNKEGLFMAVLDYNVRDSVEAVFHLPGSQDKPLPAVLESFAINYLNGICTNPLLGLTRIIAADFNQHDSIPTTFWQGGPVHIHQSLIEFLDNNELCQPLNIGDAELACAQLLALIKLDYQHKALLGIPLPAQSQLQAHVKRAVEAFLQLYR